MAQRILIIGAGGHGQVVADILLQAAANGGDCQPIGYLDDNPRRYGEQALGLPVFGPVAALASIPHDGIVIAIGDNRTRARLFAELTARGEQLVSAIHPSAIIAASVTIGPGTMICAGAIINPGSVIGANVILNTGCTIDHHNQIGDHAHIAPGVHTGGQVVIGAGTLIGIGAIVMPQRRVGAWSVVGAGALVQRDVGNEMIAIGVPARPFRERAIGE
ncbi:acetyltransferase [uncultured Chloroflexus sp.]|uniref:acetyltransferase n=1 Tax=uncultured Chloroflexus sp. TaxID=214040 RepID=UPI002620409C|nr:acetyltransferase [uncultured Chloroflexus sp.]